MRLDEVKKEIDILKVRHESDDDLNHVIGSDADCLYCEQYNRLISEQKILLDGLPDKAKKVMPSIPDKQLFEVWLKNGSRYLVYGNSLDNVAKLVKTSASDFVKHLIIKKKYWDGLFVEQRGGGLSSVTQLMTSKRSRIVAYYEVSTNKQVRRYCYNDKPFEFLIYKKESFELLERFCKPCEIIKTKKFQSNGRVSVQTLNGAIGVSPEDVLLKIIEKMIVVISQEDFFENFSEEENYVWVTK